MEDLNKKNKKKQQEEYIPDERESQNTPKSVDYFQSNDAKKTGLPKKSLENDPNDEKTINLKDKKKNQKKKESDDEDNRSDNMKKAKNQKLRDQIAEEDIPDDLKKTQHNKTKAEQQKEDAKKKGAPEKTPQQTAGSFDENQDNVKPPKKKENDSQDSKKVINEKKAKLENNDDGPTIKAKGKINKKKEGESDEEDLSDDMKKTKTNKKNEENTKIMRKEDDFDKSSNDDEPTIKAKIHKKRTENKKENEEEEEDLSDDLKKNKNGKKNDSKEKDKNLNQSKQKKDSFQFIENQNDKKRKGSPIPEYNFKKSPSNSLLNSQDDEKKPNQQNVKRNKTLDLEYNFRKKSPSPDSDEDGQKKKQKESKDKFEADSKKNEQIVKGNKHKKSSSSHSSDSDKRHSPKKIKDNKNKSDEESGKEIKLGKLEQKLVKNKELIKETKDNVEKRKQSGSENSSSEKKPNVQSLQNKNKSPTDSNSSSLSNSKEGKKNVVVQIKKVPSNSDSSEKLNKNKKWVHKKDSEDSDSMNQDNKMAIKDGIKPKSDQPILKKNDSKFPGSQNVAGTLNKQNLKKKSSSGSDQNQPILKKNDSKFLGSQNVPGTLNKQNLKKNSSSGSDHDNKNQEVKVLNTKMEFKKPPSVNSESDKEDKSNANEKENDTSLKKKKKTVDITSDSESDKKAKSLGHKKEDISVKKPLEIGKNQGKVYSPNKNIDRSSSSEEKTLKIPKPKPQRRKSSSESNEENKPKPLVKEKLPKAIGKKYGQDSDDDGEEKNKPELKGQNQKINEKKNKIDSDPIKKLSSLLSSDKSNGNSDKQIIDKKDNLKSNESDSSTKQIPHKPISKPDQKPKAHAKKSDSESSDADEKVRMRLTKNSRQNTGINTNSVVNEEKAQGNSGILQIEDSQIIQIVKNKQTEQKIYGKPDKVEKGVQYSEQIDKKGKKAELIKADSCNDEETQKNYTKNKDSDSKIKKKKTKIIDSEEEDDDHNKIKKDTKEEDKNKQERYQGKDQNCGNVEDSHNLGETFRVPLKKGKPNMEAHQSIIEKKSKVDLSSHQGFNKPFEPQLKISAAKNDSKEKNEKDYNPNDSKENLEIINKLLKEIVKETKPCVDPDQIINLDKDLFKPKRKDSYPFDEEDEDDEIFRKFSPDSEFEKLLKRIEDNLTNFEKKNKKKIEKPKKKETEKNQDKNQDKTQDKNQDKKQEKPNKDNNQETKEKKPKEKDIKTKEKDIKNKDVKNDKKLKKIVKSSSEAENSEIEKVPKKTCKDELKNKKPKKLETNSESDNARKDSEKEVKKPKDPKKKIEKKYPSSEEDEEAKEELLPEKYLKEGRLSKKEIELLEHYSNQFKTMNIDKNQLFIGYKQSLRTKAEEYQNILIKNNIEKASENYGFYRPIKGDGNCTYRSIIFLYLEQIFYNIRKTKHLDDDKTIRNFFKHIFEFDFKVDINLNKNSADHVKEKLLKEDNGKLLKKFMINKLNQFITYSMQNPKESQENYSKRFTELINENPLLDFAIIAMVRTLLAVYYLKKEDNYKDFLQENQKLDRMIKEMDLEGEQIVISVLADFLKIEIKIINIEEKMLEYDSIKGKELNKNVDEILLYYRKGHYDCLYKGEYKKGRNNYIKGGNDYIKGGNDYKYEPVLPKKENRYCNQCNNTTDKWVKSRGCDHTFCTKCLLESDQFSKNKITCMVCNNEMMTKFELEKLLQEIFDK